MNVHGVHRIPMFNTDDCTRSGIEVPHPSLVLSELAADPPPGQFRKNTAARQGASER
jgi:hypothetical protein